MPQTLSPIPEGVAIVEPQDGAITIFFRLRWDELIQGFQLTPTVANPTTVTGASASVVTTSAYLTLAAARYRVSFSMHKTVADGVASSLTMTISWTRGGVALSQTFAALTTDSNTAQQNGVLLINADAATDINYAILYASNTPGAMKFERDVIVEQLA